ncbi:MAG: helix-turn-helix domain-containing protein, partial [Clostridia bacterium]|nr:helix-turn-helix domain-containing protein [Clostridia bacterium]
IEPKTKYKMTDAFSLSYTYFLLPTETESAVLFIGPYLSQSLSKEGLLELGERAGIKPSAQKYFEQYYATIPLALEDDRILTLIDTFCEHIWRSPSFDIVEKSGQALPPPASEMAGGEGGDVLASVKMMEARYGFENELMQAVTLGQRHKEKMLASAFEKSEQAFEKRLQDPVRNAKNYTIIMNTLLRKAAEQGGVHPVYIDRTSSGFAAKIEKATSVKETFALMREMFSAYCRLVYKHSLKNYSPLVQKAVLIVDADLSANLSLSALALQLNVSAPYLASVFKKETQKTVSQYVTEKRMRHAMHLLATTHLQVQTVALHCGVMDVQYFSKLFKKQVGKTPKDYRASVHSAE